MHFMFPLQWGLMFVMRWWLQIVINKKQNRKGDRWDVMFKTKGEWPRQEVTRGCPKKEGERGCSCVNMFFTWGWSLSIHGNRGQQQELYPLCLLQYNSFKLSYHVQSMHNLKRDWSRSILFYCDHHEFDYIFLTNGDEFIRCSDMIIHFFWLWLL